MQHTCIMEEDAHGQCKIKVLHISKRCEMKNLLHNRRIINVNLLKDHVKFCFMQTMKWFEEIEPTARVVKFIKISCHCFLGRNNHLHNYTASKNWSSLVHYSQYFYVFKTSY